jgi:precorrin-2/cobalt-factor-2 C20-methyltransferase
LYGLGVGPGDPDLITLKALRLLRACPVLAWPAPEEGDAFARSIVAPHLVDLPPRIEIPIRMPIAADRFPAQAAYDRAVELLAPHLGAGRDVAVICQGDPFFYGSFMYLFARLAGVCSVVIVPGVSSLTATAAAAGHPLVAREDVLTVLPGTLDPEALAARLVATDAAVVVKLGRHAGRVQRVLAKAGLLDRATLVVRASLPDQRVVPFAAVDPADVPYFAAVLVHRRGRAVS